MSLQAYLAFVAACIALALIPGPVVTLVIANGLRHGTRAALTNILGVQAGYDRDRHRGDRADLADGDDGLLV
jgi:threonine/homoserine/homoserine lactone efflux protein